jgi:hypothetical protein
MVMIVRTRPRSLRERLIAWLIGDRPLIANISLDDPGSVTAEGEILAIRTDLGPAWRHGGSPTMTIQAVRPRFSDEDRRLVEIMSGRGDG